MACAGSRLGALLAIIAGGVACAHVQSPASVPRIEIEYHPGLVGESWSLSVYDDGTLIQADLYGPRKRELPVSTTFVRAWLERTRTDWPTEEFWLGGVGEDVDSIVVRVRAERGPATVKIEWPSDSACSDALQATFAIWNDLVGMMGKACPQYPCEILCKGPRVPAE